VDNISCWDPTPIIDIEAFDECNRRINVEGMARSIKAAGAGFVGPVGVQANRLLLALDPGRLVRAVDMPWSWRLSRQRLPVRTTKNNARFAAGA
jgi:hypothetical protein